MEKIETVWTYSEEEKALGHRMRALTGVTDKCDYCGAMVNDCQNWPGEGGGTVFEPCKRAPKLDSIGVNEQIKFSEPTTDQHYEQRQEQD